METSVNDKLQYFITFSRKSLFLFLSPLKPTVLLLLLLLLLIR